MVSHFSLMGFVRSASDELLNEYFQCEAYPVTIDSGVPKKRRAEYVVDKIGSLNEAQRARIEDEFRRIHRLATDAGIRRIIEEARFQGIDLGQLLQPRRGHLDKAFQTYLDARAIFDSASLLAAGDILPGRYWKRRLPLTGAPDFDPGPKIADLQRAISTYFLKTEGRGGACKIDYYGRRPLHHFFAFPEDYSASQLVWSHTGLQRQNFRPAFEVVFVYDENAGFLDIYFAGARATIEELRHIYARVMLDIEDLADVEPPAYALEPFKNPDMAFVREPDGDILDIRIKRLGFRILGENATKVSVEADPSRDPRAIFHVLDRVFAREAGQSGRYVLSQVQVTNASLQALIDRHDGKRPRKRTFDLSPRSCSLKYDDVDLLLRKVLIDSGIDLTGQPEQEAGLDGSAA